MELEIFRFIWASRCRKCGSLSPAQLKGLSLQNDLGLELKSSSKYRAVNVKYFNSPMLFRFDGLVSKLHSHGQKSGFLFYDFFKLFLSLISGQQNNHRSTYFKNGSPDLTRRWVKLLKLPN